MVRKNRNKSMRNRGLINWGDKETPTTRMEAIQSSDGTEYLAAVDGAERVKGSIQILSIQHPVGTNLYSFRLAVAGVSVWVSLRRNGDGSWITTDVKL